MVSVEWPSPRYFLYRQPSRSVRNRGGWFKSQPKATARKHKGQRPATGVFTGRMR